MPDNKSILIVDDNPSLLSSMRLVLQHQGYKVSIASNGMEAIELVKEQPFDIIFMDIKMPAMGGVEAFKRIKMIRSDAVVMMMTAYEVEDLVREAMQSGVFGVVHKPFNLKKTVTNIQRALDSKKGSLILIVDDDFSSAITLKNILFEKGCRVGTAFTGEDAVDMAREREYDIVFIDMNLPAMNGLETYLAMKEINPGMVAIMITGYYQEMEDLIKQSIQNDAYTCLKKPLDMDHVLEMVEKIREQKNPEAM